MKLYLKWLDRYQRRDAEGAPIGSILCAEVCQAQVELFEMHKDGIFVVEHWTVIPSKDELQIRIHRIVQAAVERVASRENEASTE